MKLILCVLIGLFFTAGSVFAGSPNDIQTNRELLSQVQSGILPGDQSSEALTKISNAIGNRQVTLAELGTTVAQFRALRRESYLKWAKQCIKVMETTSPSSKEYKIAKLLACWIADDLEKELSLK